MRTLLLSLSVLALARPTFAAPPPQVPSGTVIHEAGALYLESVVPSPVRLPVVAEAPIFFKNDMERSLGVLRKGQLVELQAIREDGGAYRVRGLAQQGQVAGWVAPKYLAPLKREFLEAFRSNVARQQEVKALIERNEVAVNMTPAEVVASLGKPGRTTSRMDAGGKSEVWEFIRYVRVPTQVQGYDRVGRVVVNTMYVKQPAGKLAVVFQNNLVASMEQTEGTLDPRAKIVISPVAVNF